VYKQQKLWLLFLCIFMLCFLTASCGYNNKVYLMEGVDVPETIWNGQECELEIKIKGINHDYIADWEVEKGTIIKAGLTNATYRAPDFEEDGVDRVQVSYRDKKGRVVFNYILPLLIRFKGIYFDTFAYDTQSDAKWFIDSKTKIAMGKDSDGIFANSSYRFHVEKPDRNREWQGEFFCQPDTVILAFDQNQHYLAYNGYLRWDSDTFLRQDKKFARISLWRTPNTDIKYIESIPRKEIEKTPNLLADIQEDISLYYGNPVGESRVYITNRYSKSMSFLYIYQDAAYMWLPQGNQDRVQFIFFPVDDSDNLETLSAFGLNSNNTYFFAGTYHPDHNILSGVFTTAPASFVATLPSYIGNKEEFNYFVQDETVASYDDIIQRIKKLVGFNTNEVCLKNRAVAIFFDQVKPGETRAAIFYRVMLYYPGRKEPIQPLEWKKIVVDVLKNKPS